MNAPLARDDTLSLRSPLVVSLILHLLAVTLLFAARPNAPPPSAPTYRVNLVAAPPGERQIGVVSRSPAVVPPPPPATPAPAPLARATPAPERMRAAAPSTSPRAPRVATPNAGAASTPVVAAPRAGGGETGGRGADVANVKIDGIEFPYPGYLDNVVRQIALRFKPARGGALTADVAFLIRRDGSVTGLRLQRRSGVFSFDTEALGAVDAAAQARAFGPLPPGFSDDVLPVIFSFDPRLIR